MTTSGSTNYTLQASEIISFALQKINVKSVAESVTNDQSSAAVTELNLMLKGWMKYPSLWRRATGRFLLKRPSISGITAADPAVVTTSAAHELNNGDRVVLDAPGGMTEIAGQTATAANKTSTTFEMQGVDASGYTAYTSGGTVGVLGYGLQDTDPYRIYEARFRNLVGSLSRDIPMFWFEWEEYWELPVKASQGIPTNYHFNPRLTQTPGTDPDYGILYTWPVQGTIGDPAEQIEYTYQRRFEDIDDTSNHLDIVQDGIEVVGYNLAERLLPDYGMTTSDKGRYVIAKARELKEEWLDADRDQTIRMMPDYRYG